MVAEVGKSHLSSPISRSILIEPGRWISHLTWRWRGKARIERKSKESVGDNDDGILMGDMQVSTLEKIVQGKEQENGIRFGVKQSKCIHASGVHDLVDHDR